MLPCVHALILLKGLQVLDSIVRILYLVRHDKLHLWKTSVAYEMFWGGGGYTVSDIFSSLVLGMYTLLHL